jgi:spore coat protein A, manganese oxidase
MHLCFTPGRLFLLAILSTTLSGCPADAPADAAVQDMTMTTDDDLSVGDNDLSLPDGGSDMVSGPDLDNHLPLKLPADAVPLKQDGGVDYYELHVKEAQVQVFPGNKTTIWGFEGQWPGPTVHATLGRPTTIKIFNDLPVNEPLSIHNHGHNVVPAFDGHPSMFQIPQNTSYEYRYPNMQEGGTPPNIGGASTYFFHDHVIDLTAPHFYKGIAAFYLIHPQAGSTEAALNLPSGAYDIPLMIQDKTFNADNSLAYNVSFINGFQGNTMVVNGTPNAYLNVARRKYRFRLLNASNARRINVGISSGSIFQIGTDGGLLRTLLNPSRIPMAPAERVDIVINFASFKIGDVVTLTNSDPFDPVLPEIIQFRVNRDEADTSSLPFNLNQQFTQYSESSPTTTREREVVFDFDNGAGQWRLNGQTFNAAATEFTTTKLGDVEVWTLKNDVPAQPIPHPFHQHLIEFQVLSICPVATPNCGTAPPGTQSGWKDTVLVPAGSAVRIKQRFYYNGPTVSPSPFPGTYVFHCHNLEHEDHAMMLQQQIQP